MAAYYEESGEEWGKSVTSSETAPSGAPGLPAGVPTGGYLYAMCAAPSVDLDGGAGNLVVYGQMNGGPWAAIATFALTTATPEHRMVYIGCHDRVALRVTGLTGGSPSVSRRLRLTDARP